MPPSIVLEVLKILEAEIQLRESTRATEQAKKALGKKKYAKRADKLTKKQASLHKRTQDVVEKIRKLPKAKSFGKEIKLLNAVAGVMKEARDILAKPDTGADAIAAETEAIELLLQARRANPNGGGGGGSSPGGGGGGTTNQSALAKIGAGSDPNAKIKLRPVSQATGKAGRKLPDEYRSGLDAFFNKLEKGKK